MKTCSAADLRVDLSGAAITEAPSLWMSASTFSSTASSCAPHQALHDPLTGLANRRLLEDLLRRSLAQTRRTGQGFAVCCTDLDGFKPVNGRHGHDAEDVVLRTVGQRLCDVLRANDTVARLGGDGFAWILADVETALDAQPVLLRCMDAVQRPIALRR